MKNRRKQRQSRTHAVKWGLLVVLAALCFLGWRGAAGLTAVFDEWTADLPSVENSDAFNTSEKSIVYASDGKTVLAEFRLEDREPLDSLDQISKYVLDGTVAVEDSRFYQHHGVDLYGITRAVINNFTGGSQQGASTITQQLVRNTILSDEMSERSLKRKVREAKLALNMEEIYSKDQVLLMYLNTINYGDGCYGIEAAAEHYFSKSAKDLTLAQAAMLIGIPQSPSALTPTVYPDACKERRNVVLNRLESAGVITADECTAAKEKGLGLKVQKDDSYNGIYLYPYFTTYVRDLLLEEYTTAEIFQGGWKIYTTLNVRTQKAAEKACKAQEKSMDSKLECALVALDPNTGFVKAMVGGESFAKDQFNIAVQKGRPTGSSFKMFTLVTALEQGISPNTPMDCSSPYKLKEEGVKIENFGNIDYGTRSITRMTAVSSNTGYVQLLEEVGADNIIKTARKMGIKNADLPQVKTLTLGVADITPLEMATAYGTLATNGVYHKAQVIRKIENRNGKVIYKADTKGERVLDESIAYAATKALQSVFYTSEGTASGYAPSNGQPVAGKTGTTENFLDHWLVGYCPDLVCATWIGDRYNQIQSENLSCNSLWKSFMDRALKGKEIKQFTEAPTPKYDNPFNGTQKEKLSKEKEKKKQKEEAEKKKQAEEAAKKAAEEAEKAAEEEARAAEEAAKAAEEAQRQAEEEAAKKAAEEAAAAAEAG